ncbi:MAG: Ldh family oxidoreductase [Candidatus Poribacteria bacterium]
MAILSHTVLREFSYQILKNAGATEEDARIVSDHLVDANLAGHDSHGVIRMPGYARGVKSGGIKPSTEYEIVKETPTTAVIDGRGSFGISLTLKATKMAIEKARNYTFGAVGIHRCSHIGRLGDYPPRIAAEGMVGLVLLNGGGRFTVPFGGLERRLPPNPLAFSAPINDGKCMMLDMTTSVVAGGKIDIKRARGQELPQGWVIDADGKPMLDPNDFARGAVLPLGGLQFGHKGYGLAMMIDVLAGGLSWAGCSRESPTRGASGVLVMAINISSFIELKEFQKEVQLLVEWVKSSAKFPGFEEIYYPGEIEEVEREKREREGIYIEDETWRRITEVAEELGVPAPT